MRKGSPDPVGFTLIELMIVVAIIAILAAIAIPRFADMIRKSAEGATKGNLSVLRSAIEIYYGDMEGNYPGELAALTINGKYLASIPVAKLPPYHPDSSAVLDAYWGSTTDNGGWQYNPFTGAANQGQTWVNCDHTDTKGTIWTDY